MPNSEEQTEGQAPAAGVGEMKAMTMDELLAKFTTPEMIERELISMEGSRDMLVGTIALLQASLKKSDILRAKMEGKLAGLKCNTNGPTVQNPN